MIQILIYLICPMDGSFAIVCFFSDIVFPAKQSGCPALLLLYRQKGSPMLNPTGNENQERKDEGGGGRNQ